MKFNIKKFLKILIFTFVIGGFFAFIIKDNMDIYKSLEKPFTIPAIVFPIVWSVLYLLMSISYYMVSNSNNLNKKDAKVIYIVQIIINSFWTLIFFGIKNYLFAFIWLILLFVIVIIMSIKFYKINKISGLLQIPYLIWLIIAGILNLGIAIMN